MATPTIVATGSVNGANTAGIAEDHYEENEVVTLTDPANTGATTQNWSIVSMSNVTSFPTVNNPTTDTADFTIPAGFVGTIRIQHDADGDSGQLLIAVLDPYGNRLPDYLEQDDARAAAGEATWNKASNTRGWYPPFYDAVRDAFDALHLRTANELDNLAAKGTLVAADRILVEDSADSFNKKYGTLTDLLGGGGGGGGASVVGGLEFMDIIEVGSPVSEVDFGASGDGSFQRALDGDVDETYIIEAYIANSGGVPFSVLLQPNGVTPGADADTNRMTIGNSTVSSTDINNALQVGDCNASSDARFELTMQAKSGVNRFVQSTCQFRQGTPDAAGYEYYGIWDDTAEQITSLRLVGSFGAGSFFVLWRRTRQTISADSASIYERGAAPIVDNGTAAEVEYHLGGATYPGSAVGLSARLKDDTVTGGSCIVRLKVGGTTVLTATLNTTDTTFARAVEIPDVHTMVNGDDITVTVETASLVTTGAAPAAVIINATFVNNALTQPARSTELEGQLWYPPLVASAYDDEFNTNSLDLVKWTAFGTIGGTAPAARATFSDGTQRIDTNARSSWLRMQNSSDATERGIFQDLGGQVPVGVYYIRCKDAWHRSSIVNGDGNFMFGLCADSGGNPDTSNLVFIQSEYDASSFTLQAGHLGGAGTVRDTGQLQGVGWHYEYFIIHYDGTNYDCYLAGPDGVPEFFSTFTHGSTLQHVLLRKNNGDQTPWNMITMVDFFRYEADPAKLGL